MEHTDTTQKQVAPRSRFLTPQTIVFAVAVLTVVALIIFAPRSGTNPQFGQQQAGTPQGNLDAMTPITSEDHIRGNPNAPVKIVEYSDTECPFCKRFHTTMQEVMKEYSDSGTVAWVYRHFPIDNLHSKARKEAEATECAGDLGGNEKFWSYLDRLMEITPANNGLDPAELPKIATFIGLDANKFNECLSSGKFAQKVESQVQNAAATGGNGTPWSIVVSKSGKKYPLSGAQPIEAIKQLVDIAVKDK